MAYKILKSGTNTVKLPGTGGQFIPAQPMVGMNLQNAKSFNMGNGDTAAHMDAQGLWLGAEVFEQAPFSVNMKGQTVARQLVIRNENDEVIIDENGINSLGAFSSFTDTLASMITLNPLTSGGQAYPVMSKIIEVPRATQALVLFEAKVRVYPTGTGNVGDQHGFVFFRITPMPTNYPYGTTLATRSNTPEIVRHIRVYTLTAGQNLITIEAAGSNTVVGSVDETSKIEVHGGETNLTVVLLGA